MAQFLHEKQNGEDSVTTDVNGDEPVTLGMTPRFLPGLAEKFSTVQGLWDLRRDHSNVGTFSSPMEVCSVDLWAPCSTVAQLSRFCVRHSEGCWTFPWRTAFQE